MNAVFNTETVQPGQKTTRIFKAMHNYVREWVSKQRGEFSPNQIPNLTRMQAQNVCRTLAINGELVKVKEATKGVKGMPATYALVAVNNNH